MQYYELDVKDRQIAAVGQNTILVGTSRGVDSVRVRVYDEEWTDGFECGLAFTAGNKTVEVPIELSAMPHTSWIAEGTVIVPDEVLAQRGSVEVTLHGVKDGCHIVTLRAYPLTITNPGKEGIVNAN